MTNKNSYECKGNYRFIFFIGSILFNYILLLFAMYILKFDFNEWKSYFAIISIIQMVLNTYIIVKLGEPLISLTIMFLWFSYIFHLSYIIIYGFSLETELAVNIKDIVPEAILKESFQYILFVQAFLMFGMCITLLKPIKFDSIINHVAEEDNLLLLRKIGKFLFWIGILPTLFIDISKVILFFRGGYLATYSLAIPGFIYTIARFWEAGIIMLVIGNKKKRNVAIKILILTLAYECIVIISGNRGRAMVFCITLVFLFCNIVIEYRIKDIIKVGFLGYLGLVLINIISTFRQVTVPNFDYFIKSLLMNFSNSPLLKAIGEFGGTIKTVCYSITYFPEYSPMAFGINYLNSIFLIFPNISGVLNRILNTTVYVNNFPDYARPNLGGSYIGELYYSFGYGGIIFAIIIGIGIALISKNVRRCIYKERYLALCILLTLYPGVLWWIRGYFADLVRDFVWTFTIIMLLYSYYKNKFKTE